MDNIITKKKYKLFDFDNININDPYLTNNGQYNALIKNNKNDLNIQFPKCKLLSIINDKYIDILLNIDNTGGDIIDFFVNLDEHIQECIFNNDWFSKPLTKQQIYDSFIPSIKPRTVKTYKMRINVPINTVDYDKNVLNIIDEDGVNYDLNKVDDNSEISLVVQIKQINLKHLCFKIEFDAKQITILNKTPDICDTHIEDYTTTVDDNVSDSDDDISDSEDYSSNDDNDADNNDDDENMTTNNLNVDDTLCDDKRIDYDTKFKNIIDSVCKNNSYTDYDSFNNIESIKMMNPIHESGDNSDASTVNENTMDSDIFLGGNYDNETNSPTNEDNFLNLKVPNVKNNLEINDSDSIKLNKNENVNIIEQIKNIKQERIHQFLIDNNINLT